MKFYEPLHWGKLVGYSTNRRIRDFQGWFKNDLGFKQGKKPRDPTMGFNGSNPGFFSWLWSPSADLRNISYKITRTHHRPVWSCLRGSAEAHVLFTYWLCSLQSSKCYPPRNYHIPSKGSWEDKFPSPLVRYVSSLEGSNLGFVSNWKTEVLQWSSVYVSRFPWRMV